MIPVEYIIAFATGVVNIFKKYIPANIVPIISIMVIILFNILNAVIFGGSVAEAGKDAFITGGICIGMFAGGDYIRKAPNSLKCSREDCKESHE